MTYASVTGAVDLSPDSSSRHERLGDKLCYWMLPPLVCVFVCVLVQPAWQQCDGCVWWSAHSRLTQLMRSAWLQLILQVLAHLKWIMHPHSHSLTLTLNTINSKDFRGHSWDLIYQAFFWAPWPLWVRFMRRYSGISLFSLCQWYWQSVHKCCCGKLTSLRGLHPKEINLSCLLPCQGSYVVPVAIDTVIQASGLPLRLDLTVRSIRCSEPSLGCCPPEALWLTFDRRWFVFGAWTDSGSC